MRLEQEDNDRFEFRNAYDTLHIIRKDQVSGNPKVGHYYICLIYKSTRLDSVQIIFDTLTRKEEFNGAVKWSLNQISRIPNPI